jgi:hypothetical protein
MEKRGKVLSCSIYFVGLLSCFADVATTWIGFQEPYSKKEEFKKPLTKEENPLANPFIEAVYVLGGQAAILRLGKELEVNPKVTKTLALAPTAIPFTIAIRNIAHIAIINAEHYPFDECPFLYPEE